MIRVFKKSRDGRFSRLGTHAKVTSGILCKEAEEEQMNMWNVLHFPIDKKKPLRKNWNPQILLEEAQLRFLFVQTFEGNAFLVRVARLAVKQFADITDNTDYNCCILEILQ